MKYVLLLVALMSVSCRDERRCEKFKVTTWCENKSGSAGCGDRTSHDETICNDKLDNLVIGKKVLIHETEYARFYALYERK